MRLTTFDAGAGARVGLASDAGILDLTERAKAKSLRSLIAEGRVAEMARYAGEAPDHPLDGVAYLPPIPAPAHIWCVGVNYMYHLQEAIDAGLPRSRSDHPMIFRLF